MTVAAIIAAFTLGQLAGYRVCRWWLALDVDAERNEVAVERARLAGERARLEAWARHLTVRDVNTRDLDTRTLHLVEQARTLAADAGRIFDQDNPEPAT